MIEPFALVISVFFLLATLRYVYKRNTDIKEMREDWGLAYRQCCGIEEDE